MAEYVIEILTPCTVWTSSQVVFVFLKRAVGQKISPSFSVEFVFQWKWGVPQWFWLFKVVGNMLICSLVHFLELPVQSAEIEGEQISDKLGFKPT